MLAEIETIEILTKCNNNLSGYDWNGNLLGHFDLEHLHPTSKPSNTSLVTERITGKRPFTET